MGKEFVKEYIHIYVKKKCKKKKVSLTSELTHFPLFFVLL